TTELANYDGNYTYGDGPKGVYRKETTEVGSFKIANEFGLYDMHGNVWEWCQDDWHNNYEDAPTDGSAWISNNAKSYKLLRGGSWSYNPGYPDSDNYKGKEKKGKGQKSKSIKGYTCTPHTTRKPRVL
ncbi:MAG: formylglycine-generating enzyme family protein, partial [Dolichospermum sp.]